MRIDDVEENDEGFYHCIAKNEAGQAIGVRQLIVTWPEKDFRFLWVECDENGQPVVNTFAPDRGDTPHTQRSYLHQESISRSQDEETARNGTEGMLIMCLPEHSSRGPRRINPSTIPVNVPESTPPTPTMPKSPKTKLTVLNCLDPSSTLPLRREVTWSVKGARVSDSDAAIHAMNNGSLVLQHSTAEEPQGVKCSSSNVENARVQRVSQVDFEISDLIPRVVIPPTRIYTHPLMDITVDCKLKSGHPLTTRV